MRRRVLHRRAKRNLRSIGANAYFARIFEPGSGVRRPVQAHDTLLGVRNRTKSIVAIIERVGNRTGPMLIVLGSFWHGPDFIAPVVEPLERLLRWRKVLPSIFWIDEEERMACKRHLHQPST